jgi:hypothetical protein
MRVEDKIVEHKDFKIGVKFECGGRQWLCTDVGSRIITAICIDEHEDNSWYNGPPYAVAERVFDEDDQGGCTPSAE